MTVLGELTLRVEDDSDIVAVEQVENATVNTDLESDILLNPDYINGYHNTKLTDMTLEAIPPSKAFIPLEIADENDILTLTYQDARQSDDAYDVIVYLITEDEPISI